ncbi:MAG: DUF134 domain-containing protein [Bacteroidales bacterium]|nr:DUF134 domain-containing protein [Bacteroidales bacterium]
MGRPPHVKGLRPFGPSVVKGQSVVLFFEEYESIRLCDYEGMSQEEAASSMDVSRPTFTRIYESARRKIAKALTESASIVIGGGSVEFIDQWFLCDCCGSEMKIPVSQESLLKCKVCGSDKIHAVKPEEAIHGGPGNFDNNQNSKSGYCLCPACNRQFEHVAGVPCRLNNCPDCGVSLVREGSAGHQKILKIKKQNE